MTLSQAIICIDKECCRKIAISVEFGDGSRSEVFKFSPSDIKGIFNHINPLSRVLAFLDRKGSVNIVVAFTARPSQLTKQIAASVYGEQLYA